MVNTIHVPDRLNALLARDRSLAGSVLLSLNRFEAWITPGVLTFFPEYTDHGPDHLSGILETACSLITEQAWNVVSAGDAAVLVLSTLLHDCAMHLREEGFIDLVSMSGSHRKVEGFSDIPWNALWLKFLAEARRFDGRKLKELFGDTTPLRIPPLDKVEMSFRDRVLIGEFLRRHHGRLAHEIASLGVPGPASTQLKLEAVDEDIADLAGIVARSHSLALRDVLPHIEKTYEIRDYKEIHAVYLMAILRIADFLQIHSTRVPKRSDQLYTLRSPISRREWNVHQAVRNITRTHSDPEAVVVDARPADAFTFFRLQDWLYGLQRELDTSWAVLGEVYGRFKGLDTLGLSLRRIRSNVDDINRFSATVSYVPYRAAFESDDPDVLKLLVGPLYGWNVFAGIRELLQNSLDAIHERDYHTAKSRIQTNTEAGKDARAQISLFRDPTGDPWVSIVDDGIGMTLDTVRNYFLKAGATLRNSDGWRRSFEDDHGRSTVLRSGRFGVGALSAYLLGDLIEVTTRHVDSETGITFAAHLDDTNIELRRVESCEAPVGTTIRVRCSPRAYQALASDPSAWDWYRLESPAVERQICDHHGEWSSFPQHYRWPALKAKLPYPWRRAHHTDYEDIQWTHQGPGTLVHNGIIVERCDWSRTLRSATFAPKFRLPTLSVFDAQAALPLNLQKSEALGAHCPFEETLSESIAKAFISFVVTQAPEVIALDWASNRDFEEYFGANIYGPWPWIYLDSGFIFSDPSILAETRVRAILSITADYHLSWFSGGFKHAAAVLPFVPSIDSPLKPSAMLPAPPLVVRGSRVFIKRGRKRSEVNLDDYELESAGDGYKIYKRGQCPRPVTDFEALNQLAQTTHRSDRSILVEWYPERNHRPLAVSPMARVWMNTIGKNGVPYDYAKRSLLIRRLRTCLPEYIDDLDVSKCDAEERKINRRSRVAPPPGANSRLRMFIRHLKDLRVNPEKIAEMCCTSTDVVNDPQNW